MAEETTVLKPDEEMEFQKWYRIFATNRGLDLNPDDYRHHYDYRGAFKEGISPEGQGHLPDTYKRHTHPTFSVESKYYKKGMKAGKWDGERFIPYEEWSKE